MGWKSMKREGNGKGKCKKSNGGMKSERVIIRGEKGERKRKGKK